MAFKSIPTEYNGTVYRSRTEARWAVFFTSEYIPFRYETEGFDFDGVRYLPDFWLPEGKCWFEVKPFDPKPAEIDKALKLAWHTGKMVFIAPGQPMREIGLYVFSPSGNFKTGWRFVYGHEQSTAFICDCVWNHQLKVQIRNTEAKPGMYGIGPEDELDAAGKHQFEANAEVMRAILKEPEDFKYMTPERRRQARDALFEKAFGVKAKPENQFERRLRRNLESRVVRKSRLDW